MKEIRFVNQDYSRKAKIWIVVATHKAFDMPEDEVYIPLHVGAEGKVDEKGNPLDFGYQKDNTGDNISALNSMYCELTGLYWAWKNLKADYIGLVHYRRLFKGKNKTNTKIGEVASGRELRFLTDRYKIVVPRKRLYFIETLYSHYTHTHGDKELIVTRNIIKEKYEEFIPSFDRALSKRWGYMFNMMIMRRDLLDEYCGWMFSIIDDLVSRIDTDGKTDFELRYPGRISELLFNVWLDYMIENKKLEKSDIAELPFIYIGKVNYIEKITSFLLAKIFHKRFSRSF